MRDEIVELKRQIAVLERKDAESGLPEWDVVRLHVLRQSLREAEAGYRPVGVAV